MSIPTHTPRTYALSYEQIDALFQAQAAAELLGRLTLSVIQDAGITPAHTAAVAAYVGTALNTVLSVTD